MSGWDDLRTELDGAPQKPKNEWDALGQELGGAGAITESARNVGDLTLGAQPSKKSTLQKLASIPSNLAQGLTSGAANTWDNSKYASFDDGFADTDSPMGAGQGVSLIDRMLGVDRQDNLNLNSSMSRLFTGHSPDALKREVVANVNQRNSDLAATSPNFDNKMGSYLYGGLQSAVQNSPAMLASVLAKNPAPMLGYAGASTGLDKYRDAREAGYDPNAASVIGLSHGAIEVGTEFLPAGKLIGDTVVKSGLGKTFAKQILTDVPGEVIAGMSQNALDTKYGTGGATKGDWAQFRNELPDTIMQSALGSVGGSAAHAGVGWAAGKAMGANNEQVAPVVAPKMMPPQPQTKINPINKTDALLGAIGSARTQNKPVVSSKLGGSGWSNVSPTLETNLSKAAQQHGVDLGYMKTLAWIESRGDSNAVSPTGAKGIGQFTTGTGKQYGLFKDGQDLRNNEALNVDATARYARDNAKAIGSTEPYLLYMAHQQGAGGVAAILRAAKNGDTVDGITVGKQSLRYNMDVNGGKGKSPSQFLAMWKDKYEKAHANVNGGAMPQGGVSLTQNSQSNFNDGSQVDLEGMQADNEQRMQEMEASARDAQDGLNSQMQDMLDQQRRAKADEFMAGLDSEVEVDGQYEPTQWQLIEADNLDPTMQKADNQFRDRTRVASELQVDAIANNLDYRKLNEAPVMDYGAPTLGMDGKIIGGNGRVAGITRAYANGKAEGYKGNLAADAGRYGFTPEQVAGMNKPVLVRRFKNFVDTTRAAIASNEGGGLSMSTLEQAKADGVRLPDLKHLDVNDLGELNTAANRDFIRSFVGGFPQNQQASFVDSSGLLSQQGLSRLRNAMLYKAYGDTPQLQRMIESTDQGSRNIANAMTQAAPTVADAKNDIANGDMHDADITKDMLDAVDILTKIKAEGGSLREYLAQRGLFGEDLTVPARKLLRFLNDNINSAKKIRTFINAYYDALGAQGSPKQSDMFGESTAPDKNQLLDKVIHEQTNPDTQAQSAGDLFDATEPTGYDRSAGEITDERTGQSESERSNRSGDESSPERRITEQAASIKADAQAGNNTAESVAKVIADKLGIDALALSRRLPDVAVRDNADGLDVPANAQAFFNERTNKITLIADRIKQGDEFGVFLHEVFHKRGVELLGDRIKILSGFVQRFKDRPQGSIERTVYEAAHKRAKESGDYDGELVAYSIEEAAAHGVDIDTSPVSPVKTFLQHVAKAFTDAFKKLLPNYKGTFSTKDLMAIARGAANLELSQKTDSVDANAESESSADYKYSKREEEIRDMPLDEFVDQHFSDTSKESIEAAEKDFKDGKFFDRNGELKVGKWAFDQVSEIARAKYSPLQMLKLTNNKPAAFKEVWHDFVAAKGLASHNAMKIAQAGTAFEQMERDLIGDVMTKELAAGVEPPEHVVKVAAEMRAMLNEQTDALVELGMLNTESAERWRDTYLPRFYNKQAELFGGVKQFVQTFGQLKIAASAGMDGSHLKGRGKFEVVEKGMEDAYLKQGYERRGGTTDGKPIMWRDYTKAERETMGEVKDGIMRFTAGYMQTQADIAKARLYKSIAANPELSSETQLYDKWVQIPSMTIEGAGVKKYGALSGMFVHPEVFEQLNSEFGIKDRNAFYAAYRKALGYWKTTKTVYNPVAHVNNVMSNMSMIFMSGGKYTDVYKGVMDLKNKTGYYDEALSVGLIGDGIDNSMLRDMFNGMGNTQSNNDAMRLLSDRAAGMAGRFGGGLLALKRAAEKAYSAEDAVFKMASYRTARERGLSPTEAREYANTFFFDYSDVPVGVRRLRDLGVLPFISYTAKAIPAISRMALTRPHRMIAFVGMDHALNALSYAVLGGEGDEDDERNNMPEWQKGFSVYGVPKMLRLPWNQENGEATFLDVARWLPLGDFADVNNQKGGLPLPQWMMPSSPLTSIYDVLVTNKDSFTGEDFVKDYQTSGEKTKAYSQWLAQQWLPSSVGVPFSYHTSNVLDGLKSQFEGTAFSETLESMGVTGEKRNGKSVDLERSLLGAVGIKVRTFDPSEEAGKASRKTQYDAREIKADINRIRRNSSLSDETKQDKIRSRQESLARLFKNDVDEVE